MKNIILRCQLCKHYDGYRMCAAFREVIPDEIYIGNNDHSTPLSEQVNDIVFEEGESELYSDSNNESK